jgi:flagellar biosynthetic protein FliQ
MNETEIIAIGRETMVVVLQVSGPVLLAALGIGLLVALFQALTQMQEMTLVFVPKIFVVIATIIALAPFMINKLQSFTQELADRIIGLGT